MKSRIVAAALLCGLALFLAEVWLRAHLFDRVSYSNSENIDLQLKARDGESGWTLMFVGDSEVRWGIDPSAVDEGFAQAGLRAKSFNHAFDGFGASWWPHILPKLLQEPALRDVETVVVGVQLTDLLRTVPAGGGSCGALQRPVLTSAFAVDLGLDPLCRTRSWDAQFGRDMFSFLWTVRHAPAVRSMLLPDALFARNELRMNSRKSHPPFRGFQAHLPLGQDRAGYEDEFRRWKAQYVPARDFVPLPQDAWAPMVAEAGFFDELLAPVRATGRKLVLFALPTNPVVFDTFNRREDYVRNSARLREWAARRGVLYVDLGIQDPQNADEFFSDMRHLSGHGAKVYSGELATAIASGMSAPTALRTSQ